MFFADIGEVERALANKVVELQTRCTVRVKEFDVNKETGEKTPKLVRYETTVGRALLSEILPPGPAVLRFEQDPQEERDRQAD